MMSSTSSRFSIAAGLLAIAAWFGASHLPNPEGLVNVALTLFEENKLPDWFVRIGMRRLLSDRIKDGRPHGADVGAQQARLQGFVDELRGMPIAVNTAEANEQHYELPPAFFHTVLGSRKKYSSALYVDGVTMSGTPADAANLDAAEDAMLHLYAERLGVKPTDTHRILDLGCGWGSVSLFIADFCPKCTVVGLSNSAPQRAYITEQIKARGLTNLRIVTANIVTFDPEDTSVVRGTSVDESADGPAALLALFGTFDRVITIEMFEHMKNYELLLHKVSKFMAHGARLFVHIFTNKDFAYHFEAKDPSDWMARYFFTGGTMPSRDLLHFFQKDVTLRSQWEVNGLHYSRTLEGWLQRMDANEASLRPLLAATYGKENETKWWVRWRGFFLACSELFKYDNGNEWYVSHYLFEKK